MPRNRIQFQKGLSDAQFLAEYGTEEQCRAALFAFRWPGGFRCPGCHGTSYSELKRGKGLMQCSSCRLQTSLTAKTIFDNTKLSLTVWFRAMHLITQTKHGISSMELSRRLGVSVNAAWRIQHKLMQAMHERDRDGEHKLGDRGGLIQMDDAYLGGERNHGKRGRGAAGKTPFIAAVETDDKARPQRVLLQRVAGFRKTEVETLRTRAILSGSQVTSDGLSCFNALAAPGEVTHVPIATGGRRSSARLPEFFWVNTVLANVKNSILGTYRAVRPKHVPRYLAQFQWRFNRRFDLENIHRRLAYAAAHTPPMPYRLLRLPENQWG